MTLKDEGVTFLRNVRNQSVTHYHLAEDLNPLVIYKLTCISRGGAVVEALRYKPECRGIDSRWCHWNFSLT
jgi:hypothetical protein